MTFSFTKRIISDQRILSGRPVIRGTRMSVEFILELVRSGMSFEDIMTEYPQLKREDLEAAILFAKRAVTHEEIVPLTVARVRA